MPLPELVENYSNNKRVAKFINDAPNIRANLIMNGLAYDDYLVLLDEDIADYLCLLSVIDGQVNESEIEFINQLLNKDMDAGYIRNRADALVGNSNNIPHYVPRFLSCLCVLDKMNSDSGLNMTQAELSVLFFESLGFEMMVSDMDMAETEMSWLLENKKKQLATVKNQLGPLYTGRAEKTGILEKHNESINARAENSINETLDNRGATPETLHELLKLNTGVKEGAKRDAQTVQGDSEETLQETLAELDSLIGLEVVKQDVHSLINMVKIRSIRQERGVPQPPMSLHLVFSGNPGTGKTTVARLLSRIYRSMGLLSKGHLIETDRSGLVGGYVGQTAIKTKELIKEAQGGILFIDEAYTLTSKRGEGDYGQEAVDTLLKEMEDNRDDFIVIVAGYSEPMSTFLGSNPGIRSRFNKYIKFDDYSSDELMSIFLLLCNQNHMTLSDEAATCVREMLESMEKSKTNNFANGREVRNLFEKILGNQANRLAEMTTIDDESLLRIELCDVR